MSKKSIDNKIVRKSTKELKPASPADLARLRSAMNAEIDTSEIPIAKQFQPLKRDSTGALPRRKSVIRDAVDRRIKDQRITVYRFWKKARAFYPPLSQAAVHEFLKGQRQLELPSIEALLAAADLEIVEKNESGKGISQPKRKSRVG